MEKGNSISMETRAPRLRPVPGYSRQSTDTPVGIQSTGRATPASASMANLDAAGGTQRSAFASQPYRTREHLYYEGETAAAGLTAAQKAADGQSTATEFKTTNTQTVQASIAQRLAEDAPPVLSLHEAVMTPERRNAAVDRLGVFGGVRSPLPEALTFGTPASRAEAQAGLAADATDDAALPGNGNTELEDNWVTVFGFAPGQTASVLAYFSRLGAVVRSVPGQGAWVHVCYGSRWAAERALAKNASVIPAAAPGALLGVVPMRRAIASINAASESLTSGLLPEAIPTMPEDTASHAEQMQGPCGESASIFARPPVPVADASESVKDSVLSRALGYVFGW